MIKKQKRYIIVIAVVLFAAAACLVFYPNLSGPASGADDAEETEKIQPVGPQFNADTAFAFVKAQCDFGPRAMNTAGHERCLDWIVAKFKQYGCEVKTQKADLKGFDGTILKATNIMASYNPAATTRIMFCAHWDSRPWADNDPDSTNWRKPILAANDAASGVAVMLELARLLSEADKAGANSPKPTIGIDFVCFDAEDWGVPQWSDVADSGDSWALGAQHFAANLPQGYAPRYGILLDMVGGQGARFYREGMSMQYAPEIVKKVWGAACSAGYGSYFPQSDGGMITDDHIPLNQVAKIPCIDIIPYYPDCAQSSFGPTWHTLADNLEHIDKSTLKAVGQTMVQVIYTEK